MPELPEVESVRRTLEPFAVSQTIRQVKVYNATLRWAVAPDLSERLSGQDVLSVDRRAKYLLLRTLRGTLIVHLGMTGRLVRTPVDTPLVKHDHVDIVFDEFVLRYHDPRRFGFVEWHEGPIDSYPRFGKLGPEPFAEAFNVSYLQEALRRRNGPIKAALMDSKVVTGLGNIYVSEVLHRAGVHPLAIARDVPAIRLQAIVEHAGLVLREAIAAGGSSLNDYVDAEGRQGAFQDSHKVYARAGLACGACGGLVAQVRVGGRASFFCLNCQPLARRRSSKPKPKSSVSAPSRRAPDLPASSKVSRSIHRPSN